MPSWLCVANHSTHTKKRELCTMCKYCYSLCYHGFYCCFPFCVCSHYGDLGNITSDGNGVAKVDITDKLVTIVGKDSVVGRTIVVRRFSMLQVAISPRSFLLMVFLSKISCNHTQTTTQESNVAYFLRPKYSVLWDHWTVQEHNALAT